ncbi:MAG: hypothetical protein H0W93_09295 [Gammaproteobacteria bacterium]|nr:hypothetical protein [Gammaproteobacteria bacterium]
MADEADENIDERLMRVTSGTTALIFGAMPAHAAVFLAPHSGTSQGGALRLRAKGFVSAVASLLARDGPLHQPAPCLCSQHRVLASSTDYPQGRGGEGVADIQSGHAPRNDPKDPAAKVARSTGAKTVPHGKFAAD